MRTKAARDRAYHVSMYALTEENRVCRLSREDLVKRQQEIWQDCYGDMKKDENSHEAVSRDK